MAWCRPGDKPLSELMMVSLLTHIYVTWPQLVKASHFTGHMQGNLFYIKVFRASKLSPLWYIRNDDNIYTLKIMWHWCTISQKYRFPFLQRFGNYTDSPKGDNLTPFGVMLYIFIRCYRFLIYIQVMLRRPKYNATHSHFEFIYKVWHSFFTGDTYNDTWDCRSLWSTHSTTWAQRAKSYHDCMERDINYETGLSLRKGLRVWQHKNTDLFHDTACG